MRLAHRACGSATGTRQALVVLGLVLLPILGVCRPAPKDFAQPDYDVYHRKHDLLRQVQHIAESAPQIMQLEEVAGADGDYKVDIQVATIAPGGLGGDLADKARLLLVFGEHGREFITSEVALGLMAVLVSEARLKQLLQDDISRAERLWVLLQRVVFKVLPMENVAGRELVEGGRLCERKNGRGVDTNRNWDIDWGKKEKDYDPNEEFPGKAPLSEPEVKILLSLAHSLQPHVWLNVHSGMQALFTPYDHKNEVPNTPWMAESTRILQAINLASCNSKCAVGSGGKSVGYLAHGTGTDYMYEVLKVPLSFTWEIYGDQTAHFNDCFRMFNPLSKQDTQATVRQWILAILQLVELLPTHPALPLYHSGAQGLPTQQLQQQQQQLQRLHQGGLGASQQLQRSLEKAATGTPQPPSAGKPQRAASPGQALMEPIGQLGSVQKGGPREGESRGGLPAAERRASGTGGVAGGDSVLSTGAVGGASSLAKSAGSRRSRSAWLLPVAVLAMAALGLHLSRRQGLLPAQTVPSSSTRLWRR